MIPPIRTFAQRNGVKFLIVLNIWTIFLFLFYALNTEEKLRIVEQEFFGYSNGSSIDEEIAAMELEHPSVPVRYWYDHKENRHGRKKKSMKCANFPHVLKLKFHNTYWQTYVKQNVSLQLYNAYYDTRPVLSNGPIVRLLAMSNTTYFKNQTIYCQLWYEDTPEPNYVKVTKFSIIWYTTLGVPRLHFIPYLISCPSPIEQNVSHTRIPKVVSLVTSKCETATNSLRVHYEMPKYQNNTRLKFAVCIKGLNYPDRDISARLVEWIELQFILGASKIYFYELGVHPNVTKVLGYYKQRGLIDVRPITIADRGYPGLMNFQSFLLKKDRPIKVLNEVIPYNDCFYRNLYRYDFIAVQDIDEVIMPLGNRTHWSEVMEMGVKRRSKRCPNGYGSYCFRNVYFSNPSNTTTFASDIPRFMHMLQHVERNKTHKKAGINTKCFHDTAHVATLHNHFSLSQLKVCPATTFDADVAQLQHYRERPVLRQTVMDANIWRYKDKLLRRSLDALKNMGFLRRAARNKS